MVIESQTIWQLGILWISSNFIKFLIITAIFIFLINWLRGGTIDIFAWFDKRFHQTQVQRETQINDDELYWSKNIDERVKMLDKLRSTETKIRQELDKINEIQSEKING